MAGADRPLSQLLSNHARAQILNLRKECKQDTIRSEMRDYEKEATRRSVEIAWKTY